VSSPTFQWRSVLETAATISMIVASVVLVWAIVFLRPVTPTNASVATTNVRPPKPVPSAPVPLDGAAVRGAASATVGILEYSDFECPFCVRFHEQTYPSLIRDFVDSGKVVLAFRHLPLAERHPLATRAAEAAECAKRQGHFWPMLDELFRGPSKLDEASLVSKGEKIGLDLPTYRRCLTNGATDAVKRDVMSAQELSIRATPTFLIGRMTGDGRLAVARHESGAIPVQALARMIEELLGGSSNR
jgi:protein-disulfide isomerase